jgi:hypothetical protein
MYGANIHTRPPNATLSPYVAPAKSVPVEETPKRPAENTDLQYLHYDVKRQRQRQNDSSLLL